MWPIRLLSRPISTFLLSIFVVVATSSVFTVQADWVPSYPLTPIRAESSGGTGDKFGYSVSALNGYAVIGSPWAEVNCTGHRCGVATVFSYDDPTSKGPLLRLDTPSDGDEFGSATALFRNHNGNLMAVVTAPGANGGGGAAQLYLQHSSGANLWDKSTLLTSAMPQAFGVSVGGSNDTIIIGAQLSSLNGSGSGVAYLFGPFGSTWALKFLLYPSDANSSYLFVKTRPLPFLSLSCVTPSLFRE